MNELPPPHFLSGKRIIVAGARIAGLSFAIALKKQWATQHPNVLPPTLKIFERETSKNEIQRQGYTLSLRSDSSSFGLQSLQKLGVLDQTIAVSLSTAKAGEGRVLCLGQ